jgi:RHS repeat-associated protein
LTVSYIYGDDLISQDRSGIDRYYLYDGQLSTRGLTNEAGDLTDTYTYDAFGQLIDQAGSSENSFLYTGEQFDPNAGFYYLRARYYDQGVGRFLTADPYQGRMHEPVTLHKYLYAHANPVMSSDPSGLMSLHSVMSGLAIASVLQNIGIRYVSFSNQGNITWKGRLYVGSIGVGKSDNPDSAGVIIADLHSVPTNGRKAMKAKYMIIMAGLSYGIRYLPPAAYTWGDVELEIPALFDSPGYLQGPASWISATAVIDKGRSYTMMTLGYALGDLSIYPEPIEGYDIAIDFMFGASIMISR